MQEFYLFASAVAEHWLALMGGAAVIVLSFFERIRRNLPTSVWIVLASAFVFWAPFQAWEDQYRETEQIQKDLFAAARREADSRGEIKEKEKRIEALEDSRHDQPGLTVNVPPPVVRVVPVRVVPGGDHSIQPHPVLSITKTRVSKNDDTGKIEVQVTLENTGDLEAEVTIAASLHFSNYPQPFPIPIPSPVMIPRQKALESTYPLPLIKDGIAQFLNGSIQVSISLTAEYQDQGRRTRYVFEGALDPKAGQVNVSRSIREPVE